MATKLAKAAMNSAHTAGIYADMTVDGPEIGTLVVIVDRARHLPNRKTMGKQDPYCAIRLAKDAKKTETDRRGGQTPRWDQELRYTVYDSPDYHKLKVSLFNDDKKCELIGETWIDIDDILEPGGGQNDKWHSLHFKGRYAGEIQLELTFWDIRPKEEKPEPVPSRKAAQPERNGEALAGPRQPMKRRPLPAEPGPNGPPLRSNTEQLPASQQSFGPRELPIPPPQSAPPAPQPQPRPPPRHEQEYTYDEPQALTSAINQYSELPGNGWDAMQPAMQPLEHEHLSYPVHYDSPTFMTQPGMPAPMSSYNGIDLPELPPHTPRTQRRSAPHQAQHYSPLDRQLPMEYVLPQYHTPEGSVQALPPAQRRPSFNEIGPPPPPMHGGDRASLPGPEHMRILPGPPPQAIEERRIAHSHSYQDFSDPRGNAFAPSPVDTQLSTRSAPVMEDGMYDDPEPVSERDREVYGLGGPPRQRFEVGHRHSMADPRELRHEMRPGGASLPSYATPPRRDMPPLPIHPDEAPYEEAHVHRSSVPIVRPQPRSPEYRTSIARKSISPAAASPASEGLGGVAFSPDSFDVLNPNLRGASSINEPGPKYDSPEGIREAARDRRKEIELEHRGPIVDSAGRVVDPTDHLPSDTWAPEPEKKPLRKVHEVKLKFRHHPGSSTHSVASSPVGGGGGYRDSPPAGSYRDSPPAAAGPYPQQRPQSMQVLSSQSSPTLVHGSSPVLPPQPRHADVGRHRLQKKSARGAYQPAASSPLHSSPTPAAGYVHANGHGNYHSPSPHHRGSLPNSTPLREMPNYGYGSSPSSGGPRGGGGGYSSGPYGGPASSPFANATAPPIPAKIPLGRGQEEWSPGAPIGMPMPMNAGMNGGMNMGGLEAEIRNIDIGSGRRVRGGGWRDI